MEKYSVRFSKQSERTLAKIYQFIAGDSPINAENFLTKLQSDVVGFLTHSPNAGSLYKNNLRYMVFKKYIFLYRVQKDIVTVIDVYSPGQNWRH